MSYDIYRKRLNRYGNDYQSRIQGERERNFENYLMKTIYRVDFQYNNKTHEGSLERRQQDDTQTTAYLLTKTSLELPCGTILEILNSKGEKINWMVYFLEEIQASGYNKYIMLKMTHLLSWKDSTGTQRSTWAYLFGQKSGSLVDTLKQNGSGGTIYLEDKVLNHFIMPRNQYIKKDTYFSVGEEPFIECFRVTGMDIQSAAGIEYVTIDPVYERDLTPAPTKKPTDNDEDFYWLNGGKN